MQKTLTLLLLVVMLLIFTSLVFAQTPTFQPNPYVYRVTVDGCTHPPTNRRQTGFRVQGEHGIVTALHGLADCPEATINAEYTNGVFRQLTLVAVDIDRDIALLSSSELDVDMTEGLAAPHTDTIARDGLYALGYPYGKTYQEPTTQITVTYAMTLNRIIPEEFITEPFENRRSPDLQIRVLFAEAHFVPGHSGAPVLNAQDQVIGIVDGGLKEGYIGKSWLIPWPDIEWQTLRDENGVINLLLQERWDLLQKNDPQLSFRFLSTFQNEASSTAKATVYRGRLIDKSNRRGIANAEVLLIFETIGEMRATSTNSGGFFEFALAQNAERSTGLLWINAERYEILEQPVYDLDATTRFGTISLNGLPPTPTSTATVTPTPQPTATPQPMVQVRITTTGVGFASESQTNEARRKQSALLAAQKDANRNLVLWKDGAELEAVTIVDQGEVTTDTIREEVRARVFAGTVIEQSYDNTTGMAEVTVEYVVEMPQ